MMTNSLPPLHEDDQQAYASSIYTYRGLKVPHLAGRVAAPAPVLAQALFADVGQQLAVALRYCCGDGVVAATPRKALHYDADLPEQGAAYEYARQHSTSWKG